MRNKKINKDLLRAYREMVPKDLYKRIEQNIVFQERTIQMKKKLSIKSLQRTIVGMAAALVLVVSGIFGGIYYAENLAVASLVDIDVNPGIELSLSKKDQVLKAEAINEDAISILDGMNLENTDLKVAVNAIIGSMVQKGYLTKESGGSILISVQNDDHAKADQLSKELNDQVHSYLQLHQAEASVLHQTVEQKSDAESFAAAHKISLGKAVFVLNLVKKDPSLKAEELAKLSLREIASLVKEKKLDISDIVDYDADDSIRENIADEIEDTNEDQAENQPQAPSNNEDTNKDQAENQPQAPSNNASFIGLEKAKAIALNHAGLSASEVHFDGAELDRDDRIAKYEIEFQKGNVEYSYEIRATDGKILDFEKEIDD